MSSLEPDAIYTNVQDNESSLKCPLVQYLHFHVYYTTKGLALSPRTPHSETPTLDPTLHPQTPTGTPGPETPRSRPYTWRPQLCPSPHPASGDPILQTSACTPRPQAVGTHLWPHAASAAGSAAGGTCVPALAPRWPLSRPHPWGSHSWGAHVLCGVGPSFSP